MPILRLFDRQTRHLATQRAIADDPCFLHYYRIFRLRPRIFCHPLQAHANSGSNFASFTSVQPGTFLGKFEPLETRAGF